jgi:hypothetical protein
LTVIYVGIDDTDTLESRGTNQLAKSLARAVADRFHCLRIVRHQLLWDPRVPFTSKNGSACLVFEPRRGRTAKEVGELTDELRQLMLSDYVPGSDPGLCVATEVNATAIAFARRCQCDLVDQQRALAIAAGTGATLVGLGGTNDGMIGALAAVGLGASNDGGRVVHWPRWRGESGGKHSVETLRACGVAVADVDSGQLVDEGLVDVGKKLRPNWRAGHCVLYARRVEPAAGEALVWRAIKLP